MNTGVAGKGPPPPEPLSRTLGHVLHGLWQPEQDRVSSEGADAGGEAGKAQTHANPRDTLRPRPAAWSRRAPHACLHPVRRSQPPQEVGKRVISSYLVDRIKSLGEVQPFAQGHPVHKCRGKARGRVPLPHSPTGDGRRAQHPP